MSVDKVGEVKRTADGRVRQLEMSSTQGNASAINEAVRTLETVNQFISHHIIYVALSRRHKLIIKQSVIFMPLMHRCMINWCCFWREARLLPTNY